MRIYPQVCLSLQLETFPLLCSLDHGISMAQGRYLEAWTLEGMGQGDHEVGPASPPSDLAFRYTRIML